MGEVSPQQRTEKIIEKDRSANVDHLSNLTVKAVAHDKPTNLVLKLLEIAKRRLGRFNSGHVKREPIAPKE